MIRCCLCRDHWGARGHLCSLAICEREFGDSECDAFRSRP